MDPSAVSPPPDSVSELLLANARRQGDAAAVVGVDGLRLGHDALARSVAAFAAGLRSMGIGRADRVAIVLPDGPELAVAFLGTVAAAVAAPLNPAYGVEDLEFHLGDLQAAAVVTGPGADSPVRAAALRRGVPVIAVPPLGAGDGGWPGFGTAAQGGSVSPDPVDPAAVALILHTSGTTARPKQVPLSHRNLMASATAVATVLGLRPADRCLAIMPLFHIHGLVASLLAPLAGDGSIVATPGFRAGGFAGWLRSTAPTWYTAVPTLHQAILGRAAADPGVFAGHGLRLIRSSSAALPPVVLGELERVFGIPVVESYGMTEAAHQMASNPLPPGVRKPGSVGRAAGPEIAILAAHGIVRDTGVTGEVVIRGPGVTAGYVANPEANATAFTGGWFRTGDEGYLDADGYLFLTGRLKEMINRGGEKVAPREVDEALLEHPDVAQAVAFGVPHPTLGEDLSAAVVLREGRSADESALRAYLIGRLPPFKVPTRIVPVPSIPKGPTGKIQRIGLHRRLESELAEVHEAPVGEWETELAGFFREALGGGVVVGRHTNFFAAGGDSLRAAALAARVAGHLGCELPEGLVFRHPTPAQLAAHLAADADSLEALAGRLDLLDPEEVERLLSEAEDGRP